MKNIILEQFKEIDYTLIARVKEDNTVHEFVAAWRYDKESDSWEQGHYFKNVKDAIRYMDEKRTEYIFRDFI